MGQKFSPTSVQSELDLSFLTTPKWLKFSGDEAETNLIPFEEWKGNSCENNEIEDISLNIENIPNKTIAKVEINPESVTLNSFQKIKDQYKIVILGDSFVGKTSILNVLFNETSPFQRPNEPKLGIDVFMKNLEVNKMNLKLQLWDISGDQKYEKACGIYLSATTDVFVLVFDLTNAETLKRLAICLDFMQEQPQRDTCLLLGNKGDLRSQRIPQEMVDKFIAERKIRHYYEVTVTDPKTIHSSFKDYFDKVKLGFEDVQI